jgi:hypothetical protein
MSEWYDNQKQPSRNIHKLLQERIEKAKQPEPEIEVEDDLAIDRGDR